MGRTTRRGCTTRWERRDGPTQSRRDAARASPLSPSQRHAKASTPRPASSRTPLTSTSPASGASATRCQRHPPRGRAAGGRATTSGVTPYHPQAAPALGRPRPATNRVLFCQREAAETAIFLAEVAGRHGDADYRRRLDRATPMHNDGLPRVGAEDGDRHRQDGRDGDAHRLADDQQGRSARTTRASPSGSWSSRPASRSATGSGAAARATTDNYYRRARPGPAGPAGAAARRRRS